jgi:hypothetical protein
MAKTTAPLLSFGASGSLAKTLVASKWKGRPYMRQHVVPANPQTAGQTSTRQAFTFASNVWKNLGPLAIAPWDRFATGQVLTGRNAFTGSFVRNVRGEVDLALMEFSPGAKGGPALNDITITPAATQLTMTFDTPTPPTGWTIQGCVGVLILDQDYAAPSSYVTIEDEDLVPAPYEIVFAGLVAATTYACGGFIRWVKPDLSLAYSPSITKLGTTP